MMRLALVLVAISSANADLLFSEVAEGSGNNSKSRCARPLADDSLARCARCV